MARASKPPTPRTIQRMVTRLQAAMAEVYGEAGERREERTNENGTMVVRWRSGRAVRRHMKTDEEFQQFKRWVNETLRAPKGLPPIPDDELHQCIAILEDFDEKWRRGHEEPEGGATE